VPTLYSQTLQQIADRFYDARQRSFDGLARYPKEKKAHKRYSLVYPQSGWKVLRMRWIRTKSKKHKEKVITLKLSNLGIFNVIVHRDFPLDKVKRVILTPPRPGRARVPFQRAHRSHH
jgi:hypothetical protein